MNHKLTGFITVLALSVMSFAQAPAAAAPAAAPAAEPAAAPAAAPAATPEVAPSAPAEQNAPAAVEQATPATETAATPAPAEAVPAAEPAPEAEAAPVAVRGGEAPVAEPVEEPAVTVAPKAVRGADAASSSEAVDRYRNAKTVYYETVYTREDGVPVRTVYVAQRESKDTVTMDKLMGLYPMNFKIGGFGSVGAYQISGNEWDSDHYDGLNWKAGVMSIIPLNEYTMGVKFGVLYEQSEASESYLINDVPTSFKFRQKKIDVPVLFTFKAANSRVYFDLGAELSIPLYDKLSVSYTNNSNKKVKNRIDLMDENFRNSLDWGFLFGLSIMANKYVSLDIHADLGLSNMYEGHMKYMNMDLNSSSFNVGLTLYPF